MKKKLSFLLLSFTAPFYFAQQAGDVISFEKNLDLTPQGVVDFISTSLGDDTPPDFAQYLNSFNVGLKGYKITYYTKNEKNVLVKATGLLMYPNVNYKLSTVVSEHGTSDSRYNVPSNLKGIFKVGFALELAYALNGYILMAPDYVGMGTGEGVHPFVDPGTEAGSTIDFVTAANEVLGQLAIKRYDEYFLTGYSQGAHAAMATLKKLNNSNPSNLRFKYAYTGAGPYDFSDTTINKGVIEKNEYPLSAILAYVVHSCNNTGFKVYNNDISEVISPEYVDKYNYHVIQDNGGLLWAPKKWRNLFTQNFVNNTINNENSVLRKCLKSKDVYDWYNKTPMTLSHSTIDNIIPPQNTPKTLNVQRGYYPFWDTDKYKLDSFFWGPLDHAGGAIAFLLASSTKFNSLRSGGFFNQNAKFNLNKSAAKSIQEAEHNEVNPLYSSQLKPDLGNMELLEISDLNKEKLSSKSRTERNLDALQDGVYLLKVQENNEQKVIPYVKNTPQQVTEKEIVQSENNGVLKLRVNQDELTAVHIFDENHHLVKTVSQQQYVKNDGIDLQDLEHQNYTFEIGTQFYHLQFNKAITGKILETKTDIYTQNRQIIARSGDDIKNISIYSISGALVTQQEVNKTQFESKTMESGIYIVQATLSDGKVINKKVKL